MAQSDYQPYSPQPSSDYQPADGYGEYPVGGEGGGGPEEVQMDDPGYLSPKVELLRKIKAVILLVEVLVMFLLIFIAVTAKLAEYEGQTQKPILPLEPMVFMVLMMAMFMTITGIVFRALEIKVTESGSQKVLLAHGAFRGSLSAFALALAFLLIFLYLPGTGFVKDGLLSKDDSTKEYGEETYRFKCQDEFLLTRVTSIKVKVTTGSAVDIAIVSKDLYENFTMYYHQYEEGNRTIDSLRQYCYENRILFNLSVTSLSADGTKLPYGEYRIFTVISADTAKIHYELQREIQPNLLSTLVVFLAAFTAIDGAWWVVALAIKQKYKKYSIYS